MGDAAPLDGLYSLKHPIDRRNSSGEVIETVTEVTVRRAKGKDLRVMDRFQDQPSALALKMIEQLTELTQSDVDNLDAEDVEGLGERVFGLLPGGPTTGATG